MPYTLRLLARSPLLTLVAVLSLGLGIGANTAIFSLLHQIVLRTLPAPEPEQLAVLKSPAEFKGGRSSTNNGGGMDHIFSYRMFRGLEGDRASARVAGFRTLGANLAYENQTVNGSVTVVSGQYFPVLGVKPRMGRLIEPEDDVHGAGRHVAVLSHGYWQGRLGGRTDVLNQPLRTNGHVLTIVGVAPKGFTGTVFGEEPNIFVPLSLKPLMTPGWDGTDRWDDYWIYVFARIQPGTARQQAEAALNSRYAGLLEEQAAVARNWPQSENDRFLASRLTLVEGSRGQSSTSEQTRVPLLILMAATALVLLIAIANTANLLLARAAQRSKELAIRAALGAGRAAIMRQMTTEALALSLAGGVAGLLFAWWTLRFLIYTMSPEGGSEAITATLDGSVLLFALGVSLVSGLLCGLYPAWDAARSSISGTLRDAGHSSSSFRSARLRKGLVCAQVTISAVLLIPTGLFLKSLVNLTRVDLGIQTGNLITFGISPELNGYNPDQSRALFERVEEQVAAIPGVLGVTASMVPLIAGSNWGSSLTVEGYSTEPKADRHSMLNRIGAGFFRQMGVPLLAGREFTPSDNLAGAKVAIVNQRFAKHFFGDRDPIGRRFAEGGKEPDIQIVGVVKDANYSSVKQQPPRVFYTPWRQDKGIGSNFFYVRSALPAEQVIAQVRQAMRSLDPDLPLRDLRTFDQQVSQNIRTDRLVLQLSAVFATLATLLAMLGLYGVMAYSVTRRTREIGIRLALGARQGTVRAMVIREVVLILLVGLAIGVPAALGVSRFTESQLFGVKAFDSAVVAGAALALTVASLLAGYLPARRATRIDPSTALRTE